MFSIEKMAELSWIPENLPEMPSVLKTMITHKISNFAICEEMCEEVPLSDKLHSYQLKIGLYASSILIQLTNLEVYRGNTDYRLKFWTSEEDDRTTMEIRFEERRHWMSIDLDHSTDRVSYALEHFKRMLKFYNKSITELNISGDGCNPSDFENFDPEIDGLENLQNLTVLNDFNVQPFLSNIQNSLKFLFVTGESNTKFLATWENTYQIQGRIIVSGLELNNEQFIKLSATHIVTRIGQLTAKNIFDLVNSWQHETVARKLCFYLFVPRQSWLGEPTKFDISELFELFGKSYGGDKTETIEFIHCMGEKRATLSFSKFCHEKHGDSGRLGFEIREIH